MKKLLLGSFLVFSSLMSAQLFLQLENTRIGVIGGPNYSRVRNAHNPSYPRYSFYGGLLALIPLDFENQFYIQPQVEYLSSGEKGEGSTLYANNYISVPIYFKGYFTEGRDSFFAFAGPRFAFLVNQKVQNPSSPLYVKERIGKARGFDFALSGGLGYSINRKFEILARYDFGLSSVYPDLVESWTGNPNVYRKKSQHILSAGVSYIFGE